MLTGVVVDLEEEKRSLEKFYVQRPGQLFSHDLFV